MRSALAADSLTVGISACLARLGAVLVGGAFLLACASTAPSASVAVPAGGTVASGGAWSPWVMLDHTGSETQVPSLTPAPDGGLVAVWGENETMVAATARAGAPFAAARVVATGVGPILTARVAFGAPRGRLVIGWTEQRPGQPAQSEVVSGGDSFSPPRSIGPGALTDLQSDARGDVFALLSAGDASAPTQMTAYLAVWPAGSSWFQAPTVVARRGTASMAVDGAGDVVIVREHAVGPLAALDIRVRGASGQLGPVHRILRTPLVDGVDVGLASQQKGFPFSITRPVIGPTGDVTFAWANCAAADYPIGGGIPSCRVDYVTGHVLGGFSQPVATPLKSTDSVVLAASPNGNTLLAAWDYGKPFTSTVTSMYRPTGGSFARPVAFSVSRGPGFDAVVADNGHAIIRFASQRDRSGEGRTLVNGALRGNPHDFGFTSDANGPFLAADSTGRFAAITQPNEQPGIWISFSRT